MKKLIALLLMSVLLLAGCGYTEEDLAAEWEEGYAQGKSDGYTVGYDEGFAAGASQVFMFQGEAAPEEEPVAEEQEPEPEPETTAESSGSSEVIVYVTDTGTKYHQSWCSSLWNSSHEKTLSQAIAAGYGPCKNCDPPVQ
jgi:competence protein ComEC